MSHTAIVRTRIDDRTRAEAAAVLARIGMTVSDFVELMLRRVARDKALPFEAFEPHAEKIEAMEEARRGGASILRYNRGVDGRSECGRLSRPRAFAWTLSARRRVGTGQHSMLIPGP